ncbi:MAG: hypothetical protein CL927_11955 [Deltaproteobacteria bacterium]|nr:hypothetical protein [Deltaproteobacteria bacterium]
MSAASPKPVPSFLLERAAREPDAVLCMVPLSMQASLPGGTAHPDHPEWCTIRVDSALHQVAGLARRLHALGVRSGDRVAIVAETSHLWAATDLAVMSIGGVTVGLYTTLPPRKLGGLLKHCSARLVIFENDAMWERYRDVIESVPLGAQVFHSGGAVEPLRPSECSSSWLHAQIAAIDPAQPAAIVYTSGTTGDSKGVVLSHAAFHHVVCESRNAVPTRPGDRSVVFLPMAHVLQRFATYRGLVDGVEGWYAPDIESLPETIRQARPHILIAVPRVLEKIRQQARARAVERSAGSLFDWASAVAEQPRASTFRSRARHSLADRLVLKRVRSGLGGHLRVIASGSAPLDRRLAAWFEGCGIAVREGWGLTETCAPATAVPLTESRPGSVGRALDGVELRVAEDGELEVRSPALFTEYLDDAEATAAAFTHDGWFRTGDLGRIDSQGFVWLTGRKKNLIITAGGRNIAPSPIEAALRVDGVAQVVVLGDRRPFLTALFFPEAELPRPEPRTVIQTAVDAWNAEQPPHRQVVRWRWSRRPLTIESGTLTPTLKVQRDAVKRHFAGLIEQLYGA